MPFVIPKILFCFLFSSDFTLFIQIFIKIHHTLFVSPIIMTIQKCVMFTTTWLYVTPFKTKFRKLYIWELKEDRKKLWTQHNRCTQKQTCDCSLIGITHLPLSIEINHLTRIWFDSGHKSFSKWMNVQKCAEKVQTKLWSHFIFSMFSENEILNRCL